MSERYENYRHWVKNRVMERSIKRENGCIEYRGGGLKHKYGLVRVRIGDFGRAVPAHRALWMAVHDCFDMPSSTYIRHKCDNPCCINIDHLESGTARDNMRDMYDRGRNAKKRRYHTRVRIHDDEKIRSIRAAVGKARWIAEEFGVSLGYVYKIKSGKAKALVV